MAIRLVPILLILAACSGEPGPRSPACPPGDGDGVPVVLFQPFSAQAAARTPIPTDAWTTADASTPTGIRLDGRFSAFDSAFAHLDGFGLAAPTAAPFLGVLDPGSIRGTAGRTAAPRLFLLDIEALGAPDPADFRSRLVPIEAAVAQEGEALLFPFRRMISMRPVRPLAPSRRYAMLVTSCVADEQGRGIRADGPFAAIRDGEALDAASERVRADVEPVLSYLEHPAIGLDRASVALATVFTTQSVFEDLAAMAELIAARPAPALRATATYPGHDPAGGPGAEFMAAYPGLAERLAELPLDQYVFDAIGTIAIGEFDAPRFLDADDILARDAAGVPQARSAETLEFILVLPREDPGRGIVPPHPVVVFQHAMTTCKETAIAVADTLARFGVAAIGIDAVAHGSRSPGGPGTCETDAAFLFDTSDFMKTTDRMRQSVADVLSLVRALKAAPAIDLLPLPSGDGLPDIDTARPAMIGQSYGGSVTLVALALAPDLGAGVCNVGGGIVSNMVVAGTMGDAATAALDLPSLSPFHIALALGAQTAAEKSDPIHFAAHLLRDPLDVAGVPAGVKQLLYQEAVPDEVFPHRSVALTAAEIGIPLVEPFAEPIEGLATVPSPVRGNLPGGGTAGLFRFSPADHAFLLLSDDPVVMRAGQLQAAIFLSTYVRDGVGAIVDPYDAAQVAPHDPGNLPWPLPRR